MQDVLRQFPLSGAVLSCEPYGSGHINDTYRVETDNGTLYILQRINTHVFPDVAGLMRNIASVTEFLSARASDPREAMHLVRAHDGSAYVVDDEGGCWRVYDFVTGSVCLQKIERAQDFYECAFAFGNFQQMMAAFPAETLSETTETEILDQGSRSRWPAALTWMTRVTVSVCVQRCWPAVGTSRWPGTRTPRARRPRPRWPRPSPCCPFPGSFQCLPARAKTTPVAAMVERRTAVPQATPRGFPPRMRIPW